MAQRLTAGDVQYIVSSVLPLLRRVLDASPNQAAGEVEEVMKLVGPLLSIETVNVLQLLGFNFKEAVGAPLTRLVANLIEARAPAEPASAMESQDLLVRRDILLADVAKDPDAAARLQSLR